MEVYCFASAGFEGRLVQVEIELRNGIPGMDIVGLPDSAVKEARERVRAACRNCGYDFPMRRILINLAPAGLRKEGAAFDLALAFIVLSESGQLQVQKKVPFLIMGELQLSGRIRGVSAVLPAIQTAWERGVRHFIIPEENSHEAGIFYDFADKEKEGHFYALSSLVQVQDALIKARHQSYHFPDQNDFSVSYSTDPFLDISDIKGQARLKRALEIAAAGGHHLLLFGPPGCGKTMAARRIPGLMPELSREEALEVSRIWSIAGKLDAANGLISQAPLRSPHHSASLEGLVGGGKKIMPGEVSLAHKGILFLDEAPEFKKSLLQALREPVEDKKISIVRAGNSYWYPADFQLVMTANPCPCGNLGKKDALCLCSRKELENYWKRVGGALLDRIDIRVPVGPADPSSLFEKKTEKSFLIRKRVLESRRRQKKRFLKQDFLRNAAIPASLISRFCQMDKSAEEIFIESVQKMALSSRAAHSVLKIALTISDLEKKEVIGKDHILESLQHRRYGDNDFYWSTA